MGKPGKSRVKFKRGPGLGSTAGAAAAIRAEAQAAAEALALNSAGAVGAKSKKRSSGEPEEDVPEVNFVPCAAWVPRGVAKAKPEKVELTKEELKRVILEARRNLRDLEIEEEEQEKTKDGEERMEAGTSGRGENSKAEGDDIESKYGFDDYDDDDEDLGLGEVAEFGDNSDDPLFREPRRGEESDDEDEDFEIKPTDNLIVTGHCEDDSSVLEVYVYNSVEESLYVHHDILLPACPLALEWIDTGRTGGKANYVAVGSMNPVIQVWDLDVVDCLEPCAKLGQRLAKKKKSQGSASLGHTDAVLALSWNDLNKQTLASGSVDQTVILWDFQRAKPSKFLRNFEEKVQSVIWHPTEVNWLLTGCGDGKARFFDVREETKSGNLWNCGSSVEKVVWEPTETNRFIAGTENGRLACYDVRQKQRLWRIEAVTDPISDVVISPKCPGLLVTASEDGEVQIWDSCSSSPNGEPSLIARRDMGVGKIMFVRFCPDEPFVICAGGDYGPSSFAVWDLRNTPGVVERFSPRVPGSSLVAEEPMEEDS